MQCAVCSSRTCTNAKMLTAEQLCFFVREGYVICEGLVPPETVRSWHAQVWSRARACFYLPFLVEQVHCVGGEWTHDCHSPENRRRAGKRCANKYTDEAVRLSMDLRFSPWLRR